jgi:hypothetical protein
VRKVFAEAGVLGVLDRELGARGEDDPWLFRFRSDGTFFIRGFSDEHRGARSYSALGSFELVSHEKGKVRLKLIGSRFPTAVPWDGVACPLACGDRGAAPGQLVEEDIQIEEARGATFIIRNRTARVGQTLPFSDLRVKRSTLIE